MAVFYFYLPPLRKISGGMQVIADLGNHLWHEELNTALVLQNPPPDTRQWLETHYPNLPVVNWDVFSPCREDWWIVPEGWPLALKPGLAARSRCVVYVQNWAFVHGHLPPGVFWQDLPVSFWAVSSPVADFLRETIGVDAPIVPPAIDPTLFYPENAREDALICWMPRKNRGLALQTRNILESIRRKNGAPLPGWIEIEGKKREEVASLMRRSEVFFASGFPEGCPLPPLEAMASGCLVAGFGGFGGWDYMRQALETGFRPSISTRPVPWGPNGFYAADADVFGAAMALNAALDIRGKRGHSVILQNAAHTAACYCAQNQRKALLEAVRASERPS